jgi:hypothetical protein
MNDCYFGGMEVFYLAHAKRLPHDSQTPGSKQVLALQHVVLQERVMSVTNPRATDRSAG